jgi:hypothetical protein
MTLREARQRIVDSFNGTVNWFLDGYENLVSGDILDLTIGQAIVTLILMPVAVFLVSVVFHFLILIKDVLHGLIEKMILFKSKMKEAKQGNADSQYCIGKMYAEGDGVVPNFVQAYKWYEISRANGSEDGLKDRDLVEKKMPPYEIAEAQKQAREWVEEHQKN